MKAGTTKHPKILQKRMPRIRDGLTDARAYAVALAIGAALLPMQGQAESPELSMRDLSSGQIKKGVRPIGSGGDGATWGNYGLVWKDAGTAIVDGADTHYTNGNDFHFAAAGLTSPLLWNNLAIYVVALSQDTNAIQFNAKSPGLGSAPVALRGYGSDRALFTKVAMPVTDTVSAGILISYETSHFDAVKLANSTQGVRYETQWRPSGGFGVAWQPEKQVIIGFRALFNNDLERRTDPSGVATGMARSAEYRLGGAFSPWDDTSIDVGGTRLDKKNGLAGLASTAYYPNLGVEQTFLERRLTLRAGLDETAPTAGLTYTFAPFKLDAAYVRNMAHDRIGNLFGTDSDSLIMTLTVDYHALFGGVL